MPYPPNPAWKLEIWRDQVERGRFRSALFDVDGTISLIREGWQQVMIPYFSEVLGETPRAEDPAAITRGVTDFVDLLTGKQTIYQCIRLAEEVAARGGIALEPVAYKHEYHRRLLARIQHRLDALRAGTADSADMTVPGAGQFLQALRERGITLYLASGTDEHFVIDEADLLGVAGYFDGGIFGARDDYRLFSKALVIEKIIASHHLAGHELVGFGDGYVEIENIKSAGGLAVGVATDEERRTGLNEWKRQRLTAAGADAIMPDFRAVPEIMSYLYPEGMNENAVCKV